ncbi:hypothetical protein FA09DRAFT_101851 [Tilletiopsis washingtonensis]|uniref:Uncharacterized protein n=1 Tax=Tilletiopsis washingtonensis TaxID=58919 RepID=A0A316Z362_9BASI|nr:hypothetical protein FA09DRAFT_101851 [Tilletiopsis washingtonensis]PWN95981.1 hypothetical protein FA09DRAFT_101851 [Tilletiopsis washingtonensis]
MRRDGGCGCKHGCQLSSPSDTSAGELTAQLDRAAAARRRRQRRQQRLLQVQGQRCTSAPSSMARTAERCVAPASGLASPTSASWLCSPASATRAAGCGARGTHLQRLVERVGGQRQAAALLVRRQITLAGALLLVQVLLQLMEAREASAAARDAHHRAARTRLSFSSMTLRSPCSCEGVNTRRQQELLSSPHLLDLVVLLRLLPREALHDLTLRQGHQRSSEDPAARAALTLCMRKRANSCFVWVGLHQPMVITPGRSPRTMLLSAKRSSIVPSRSMAAAPRRSSSSRSSLRSRSSLSVRSCSFSTRLRSTSASSLCSVQLASRWRASSRLPICSRHLVALLGQVRKLGRHRLALRLRLTSLLGRLGRLRLHALAVRLSLLQRQLQLAQLVLRLGFALTQRLELAAAVGARVSKAGTLLLHVLERLACGVELVA